MCYKYPGLRCANSITELIGNTREQQRATEEQISQLESDDRSSMSREDRKNHSDRYHRALLRQEDQQTRLRNLEAEYDLTAEGQQKLSEQMETQDLGWDEREALAQRLKQAEVTAAKRTKEAKDRAAKNRNTVTILRESGVSEDVIARIKKQATVDKGNPHPRSYTDYQKSLEGANRTLEAVNLKHQAGVANTFRKAKREGWSQEKTDSAIQSLDSAHSKAENAAKEDIVKYRFARDSTARGQEDLRKKLSATDPSDTRKHGLLTYRLQMVEKAHKDGLSDRQAREVLKRQITDAMNDVGKDPKVALNAMKQVVLPRDPALASKAVSVHMNTADIQKARAQFESSEEFKEQGKKGYRKYVSRMLAGDPRRFHDAESVEDANAEVKRFDQGLPRRHKRDIEGVASHVHGVVIEARHEVMLKDRAETLHMSVSSYYRSILIGDNPYAIQNDRSKRVNRDKTAAMKELLNENRTAA